MGDIIKEIITIEKYKSLEGLEAQRECLLNDIDCEQDGIIKSKLLDELVVLEKEIEEWQTPR